MENASKALLMAAGVLIGMLIVSLAVYLFVSFGMTSAEIHKKQEQQQLEQFNAQFTSYLGKDSITVYDIITVANLAKENNSYYELQKNRSVKATGKDNYISIYIQGVGFIQENNETENEKLIQEDIDKIKNTNDKSLPQYQCIRSRNKSSNTEEFLT